MYHLYWGVNNRNWETVLKNCFPFLLQQISLLTGFAQQHNLLFSLLVAMYLAIGNSLSFSLGLLSFILFVVDVFWNYQCDIFAPKGNPSLKAKRQSSPARQQAVSSPLGKGTAEMITGAMLCTKVIRRRRRNGTVEKSNARPTVFRPLCGSAIP